MQNSPDKIHLKYFQRPQIQHNKFSCKFRCMKFSVKRKSNRSQMQDCSQAWRANGCYTEFCDPPKSACLPASESGIQQRVTLCFLLALLA